MRQKCDFEWRAFSPFDMHLPEKIPWLLICDLSRQNFIFIRLSRYTMVIHASLRVDYNR